jgi:predicted RNA-binding protein with TRAM domain
MPGTELAFEAEVERHHVWLQILFFRKDKWKIPHKVGRFRQINVDNPATHHDAIEFPDGRVVLVTRLRPGQYATVLQLPVRQHAATEAKSEPRPASPAAAR